MRIPELLHGSGVEDHRAAPLGRNECVSRPVDPDEPTRRLPADAPPRPRAPREYEREVVVADDYAWREEMLDRLSSLRTAVVLLGVLAVAALGVALYALLTQEEEGDVRRQGDIQQLGDAVQQLDERVQAVEEQQATAP
jgi:hypothetical protein